MTGLGRDQRLPCLQIGGHVGAAETVDGLLGIANHGQCVTVGAVDKDSPKDPPLGFVGVLKFVNQGEPVAPPQCLQQRLANGAVVVERAAHQRQHVGEIKTARTSLVCCCTCPQQGQQGLHGCGFKRHHSHVQVRYGVCKVDQFGVRGRLGKPFFEIGDDVP